MSKLGKEESLYALKCFYDWYVDQCSPLQNEPQAYAQLVEIVEEYFSPTKNAGHPPTVFSEKQVEDYWKEQDAKKKPDTDT